MQIPRLLSLIRLNQIKVSKFDHVASGNYLSHWTRRRRAFKNEKIKWPREIVFTRLETRKLHAYLHAYLSLLSLFFFRCRNHENPRKWSNSFEAGFSETDSEFAKLRGMSSKARLSFVKGTKKTKFPYFERAKKGRGGFFALFYHHSPHSSHFLPSLTLFSLGNPDLLFNTAQKENLLKIWFDIRRFSPEIFSSKTVFPVSTYSPGENIQINSSADRTNRF